jgi:hypothetical protein
MPSAESVWEVPDEWLWVDYPIGWLRIFAWMHKRDCPWPGSGGFPEFAQYGIYVRSLVRERLRHEDFGEGGSVFEVTPLAGLVHVTSLMRGFPDRLAELVLGCRSAGYSWTEIGRPLGVGRTAAQKRFGRLEPAERDERPDPEKLLWLDSLRAHLKIEAAADDLLRDLAVEARCERHGWADIGDALGVGGTAAQKRFGRGLSAVRIRQLDQELVWMRNIAPDRESRVELTKRLEGRRRLRLKVRFAGYL